jgi:hypothetical protein
MTRIPGDVLEYLQKHKKTKSIRWAIKYYNDNYVYTEWDKPSGRYVKKNTDKRSGFRKKNKFLEYALQDSLTEEEIMRELL